MPNIRVDMTHPYEHDDPSEYANLPVDWPHDDEHCLACDHYAYWSEVQPGGRMSDGTRMRPRDTIDTFGQNYPNRFHAVMEHRHQLRRSRRASKA